MKRALTTLLLVCLLGSTSATVVRQLGLADLVGRAEIILQGTCLATSVERVEPDLLVTRVTLRVEQAWKGAQAGADVVIRLPGGQLADEVQIIPGMPAFGPGQEVLVFLTPASSRDLRVPVGLGQGLLRLQRDPLTGALQLVQDLAGIELVDGAGKAVPASAGPLAYEAFVAELEGLLEDGG